MVRDWGLLLVCSSEQGLTPKSGFVTTPDGMKIHYIEAGAAESVTNSLAILFVPGWTS